MHPLILLMSILLNAQTGEELSRHVEAGPFESIEDCSTAQQKTGLQKPVVGTQGLVITVHECVAVTGSEKAS